MEIINLNIKNIKRIIEISNYINSGSEASIYRCNPYRLIKIEHFVIEHINNNYVEYDHKLSEIIKKMVKKNIINTSLPKGIVNYKNQPIGSVLEYHPNCLHLNECYNKKSVIEMLEIFKNVFIYNQELINNNIYNTDLLERNILIDCNNNIHLIDLVSNYVYVDEIYTNEIKEKILCCYRMILGNYLNSYLGFNENIGLDNTVEYIEYMDKIKKLI